MKDYKTERSPTYIDTPHGILTQMGTLFSTTEDSLKEYVGELIVHEPIEKLLANADLWLRFPLNLSLWLTPLLLWQINPIIASGMVLIIFIMLSVSGPIFVNHTLSFIPFVLNQVLLQFLLYSLFLSFFLLSSNILAASLGVIFFVLFRWGIIKKAFEPVLKWITKKLYAVPYEDKVLKSLIVKKSLHYRTVLPEVNELEMSIMQKIKRS